MKSISINNISFSYKKGKDIFHDFTLQMQQGEGKGKVTAIMGSSGSGKSTLMKLLLDIESPISGNIVMLPAKPIFSYVPQEPVLFEHLSIKDNARYFQFAGVYKKRFNETLYNELAISLGLEEVVNSTKSDLQLSGGQKQRQSLLRALSIEPDFLLLDEPCNGLDAEVKRSFLNKLREITQRYDLFVLYITHHKLEAQLIADEVVYLIQDKDLAVKRSAKGTILDFMESPPVLDAAYVFRFPDVKILPLKRGVEGGDIEITSNAEEVSEYWLVEDENIKLGTEKGVHFKIVSKSSVYTVIRNEETGMEWMMASKLLGNAKLHDEIILSITGVKTKYHHITENIK